VSKNAGFTLLEILVAIALASLLLTSIYGVFSTTSAAKEQVEKKGAALHLGRVLIARLDRELLGLSLQNHNSLPALSGGTNSLGEPYIKILTTSAGGPDSGMRRVEYRLGPDQDQRMTLWRAEKGLNSSAPAVEERLAQGLEQLGFEFFDGQNWRENWDSLNNNFPRLVRAEMTLEGTDGMPALLGTFDLPQK
jgi:general secretion pathway protein J